MYRRNRELLIDCLARIGITDIAPSDGAFYIYASIAHLTDDSLALCKRLLEDSGVATAPGLDFDPERGARFIRFSYAVRSEEHTSELQSLLRLSYAVFCLKKKKQ